MYSWQQVAVTLPQFVFRMNLPECQFLQIALLSINTKMDRQIFFFSFRILTSQGYRTVPFCISVILASCH